MQSSKTVIYTKEQFNEIINHLISGNSRNCLATLGFIQKKIHQFHLNCEIYDVMNEVYLRGLKSINSGKEINNSFAWVRGTALNVIREMHRKQNKEQTNNSSFIEDQLVSETEPLTVSEEPEWRLLQQALSELKPQEQEILQLRWEKDLSWREISELLSLSGKSVTEETARKRGGRAFKRLQTKYKMMESDGNF